MNIEACNHRQIERLNQRGGRTLSIVDLVQAGTYDPTAELHDSAELGRYEGLIQGLVDDGDVEVEAVRRKAVEFYRGME